MLSTTITVLRETMHKLCSTKLNSIQKPMANIHALVFQLSTRGAVLLTYHWVQSVYLYTLLGISIISINLLVVYRESLNLIGYITRRLSADSLQL